MEMNESFLGALKSFIQNSLSADASVKNHSGRAPLAGPKNVPKARFSG